MCNKKIPPNEPFWVWCHQAVETEVVNKLGKEKREQRRNLLDTAKENPELLETVEEIEPLVKALSGNTEGLRTAREFAELAE